MLSKLNYAFTVTQPFFNLSFMKAYHNFLLQLFLKPFPNCDKLTIWLQILPTPKCADLQCDSAAPPIKRRSPFPYSESGLAHVTCLCQWDVSKHDASRSLEVFVPRACLLLLLWKP